MAMVRRIFIVDEDLFHSFRMEVLTKHGNIKGRITKEINEAIRDRTYYLRSKRGTEIQSVR
jgi:hypothetical protein